MEEQLENNIKTYEILFDEACKHNVTGDHLTNIKNIRHVLNMMRAELEDRLEND